MQGLRGRQQALPSVSHVPVHPARLKTWRIVFCIAIAALRAADGATGEATGEAPTLRAFFSQAGVWGAVTFERGLADGSVRIRANLSVASDKVGDYSWGIYAFPVDYSRPDGCNSKHIGSKPWINFDAKLNKLKLVKEEEQDEDVDEATTVEAVTGQPQGKTNKIEDEVILEKKVFSATSGFGADLLG